MRGTWRAYRFGVEWRVSLLFPALLTALLLTEAGAQTATCLAAALAHEGGHVAAMLLLGCPPKRVTVGAFGARIETAVLPTYGKNILISLAGPLVNLTAAAVLWLCACPAAGAVHALLGAMNLLPVTALDGGQILLCCFRRRGVGDRAETRMRRMSVGLTVLLGLGGVVLLWRKRNVTLLAVSLYLGLMTLLSEKSQKNLPNRKKTLDRPIGGCYNSRDK